MGTEQFVELLWRIHTKPGTVTIISGKDRYEPRIKHEETVIAQPGQEFFNINLPAETELGASTFGETL